MDTLDFLEFLIYASKIEYFHGRSQLFLLMGLSLDSLPVKFLRLEKNSLVIAPFVLSSHWPCPFLILSFQLSILKALVGILLYMTWRGSFQLPPFANRSAISFPLIPAWAFTQLNSIFQFFLLMVAALFVISPTTWLWFLMLLNESRVFFLCV